MKANLLGNNLRSLRSARGWSLGDLARQIDNLVTRQALQKYEAGESVPSPPILQALGSVFAVNPSDLALSELPEFSVTAFRKIEALGMKREKTIRNEFATKAQVRFEVERYCRAWLPEASDVEQICSKTTSPEECANELRKEWKLGNSAIRNLTSIIEDRGIHVITLEQQKGFDGVCGVQIRRSDSQKRFAIGVGNSEHAGRYRMTLAHELGHLVMKTEDEKAAKNFAGALLAPSKLIMTRLGTKRQRLKRIEIEAIADELGISPEAVIFRACELEIINEECKRFWMMLLRRQGVAKTDNRCVERSDWLVRMVSRLYSEEIIDAAKVDRWLDPETAAEIKDSGKPSTAWGFRNLTPAQRAKLLRDAAEAATEYYNGDKADIVAEEMEVYDDSTKA